MLGNREIMGRNIQRFLDEKQISRQELSEKLNIKYSTLTDWINGNTYPRIDSIEKLANFFGVSKSELVEEKQVYFYDPESARVAQELLNNPDLKMLFDAARDISPEDLKLMAEMAMRMKRAERHHPEDYPDEVYPDDFNQSPPEDD